MSAKKPSPSQDALNAYGIDAICDLIEDCQPLRAIAKTVGVSTTVLMDWLIANHHEQYARAKTAQADKMAEDILSIADDGTNDTYIDDETGMRRTDHDVIARSRLRVDARKWLASKLAPKKYGEKLEVAGDAANPLAITTINRVIIDPNQKQ